MIIGSEIFKVLSQHFSYSFKLNFGTVCELVSTKIDDTVDHVIIWKCICFRSDYTELRIVFKVKGTRGLNYCPLPINFQ